MNLEQSKVAIIQAAILRGLLTRLEYDLLYKGKYLDQYGCDSFINYLSAVIPAHDKDETVRTFFVTTCQPLLENRDELERVFRVKIRRPGEMA